MSLPAAISATIMEIRPEANVDSAVLLGRGIGTVAYRCTDPTGPWVVRISADYPRPWTWRGGRRHEVPLLRELAAAGLPVAQDPVALSEEPGGLPYAILEREVPGRPITELPADPTDLARRLADFLSTLHSLPRQFATAIAMPVASQAEALRECFGAAADQLDPPTRTWAEATLSAVDPGSIPLVPVHGDFRADHWYADADGELCGVIDFGDSAVGDPAIDFARIGYQFGHEFVALLLEHYRGPVRDGLLERARWYEALEPLAELANAGDADWWDRDEAVAALRASAQRGSVH